MGSVVSSENEGPPDAFRPPKNAYHRCRCGHIKYAHEKSQGRCGVGRNGTCGCQVFICDHSRCGWKPREECQHPDKHATGARYSAVDGEIWYRCPDCKATWSEPWKPREEKPEQCDHPDNDPCDRCLMPRSYYIKCGCGHVQGEHRTFEAGGCTNCRCKSFALPPHEPPMTPEEEEQAPEDPERCDHNCSCGHMQADHSTGGYCNACGDDCRHDDGHYPSDCPEAPEDRCTCGETACESELCDCDSAPCPVDHASEAPEDCGCGDPFDLGVKHRTDGPCEMKELPPPEGPEYTPCVCGHIVPEHEPHGGLCFVDECGCAAYRSKPDFELPPQPERRPPYLVGYSVAGHLYEVALPGDATVQAVDGALVIKHLRGFVAGITHVAPLVNEET